MDNLQLKTIVAAIVKNNYATQLQLQPSAVSAFAAGAPAVAGDPTPPDGLDTRLTAPEPVVYSAVIAAEVKHDISALQSQGQLDVTNDDL